ncbi:MAG: hypothetical protein ABR991_08910 [Terracidiphilus sp.]
MRNRVLLVGALLLGCLVCSAQAGSVAGEWRGIWTDPSGYVFNATMTLESGTACKSCAAAGDGSIRGRIVWTLRKVPANASAELAAKVGLTATEFVKGERKGDGLLVLNGDDKDDPNRIIAIDQYRLAISDDGKVIGGITLNHGSWMGQFIAQRAQP